MAAPKKKPSAPKKRSRTLQQIEAERRYEAKHRAERLQQQFEKYQKSLATRRAKQIARNRAQGRTPRPKGAKARVELFLPASRRWRIFTHPDGVTRLHFTSKKGFELDELQQILREFKALKVQA
jgi:hypothetical protein